MGWGTTVKVYFSRVLPSNADALLEDAELAVEAHKSTLIGIACATPPADAEGLSEWIQWATEEIENYASAVCEEQRARYVASALPDEIVDYDGMPHETPPAACQYCPDDETLTCSVCEGTGLAI